MSKLYVVATPIGNLKDITLRAIETLRGVDLVLAEDTRVTRKLLSHFDIRKPLISFHKYSRNEKGILALLKEGKDIALVTDAGTPGISDPGRKLISFLATTLRLEPRPEGTGVEIIPVPGPSALTAIISVSDIDLDEFVFLGFPPRKKGRQTFFKRVAASDVPVILYEAPHRIQKTLLELQNTCGDRYVNIGRELTKIHEEIFRGFLSEAQKHFVGERQRGEFVIVISNREYTNFV